MPLALAGLISKLEERIKKIEHFPGAKRVGFVRHKRVLSTAYLSTPPPNAPSWAICNNRSGT